MQEALDLEGGWHAGPLFVIVKQRPLVRPKGDGGVVHRAQTRRATPAWSDRAAVRAVYAEAKRLTLETGELHVVDHIVPKISRLVCGLHVPANLRVVHWAENVAKGNFWWPDGPFEQLELE